VNRVTTEEKFIEPNEGQNEGSKCVPPSVHLLEQYPLQFRHMINNVIKWSPIDIFLYIIHISIRNVAFGL